VGEGDAAHFVVTASIAPHDDVRSFGSKQISAKAQSDVRFGPKPVVATTRFQVQTDRALGLAFVMATPGIAISRGARRHKSGLIPASLQRVKPAMTMRV
jgi:hypothetical protein